MDTTTIDLEQMGKAAKAAAAILGQLTTAQKNAGLLAMADALEMHTGTILAANQEDLKAASMMPSKFKDRLVLTEARIADMAAGVRQVAVLDDPTAQTDRAWVNYAGLTIAQKRVPLGVVGMIYEARPNVTVDAAALTFKSGNAVILRGGKEALHSNMALATVLQDVLATHGLPSDAVQLVTDTRHEVANQLMHLNDYLDVLIPRGGRGLIKAVVEQATVPVIETGAGNCHIYVDAQAQLDMAVAIVVNAKVQRPSVCNAAEKLLIHADVADEQLPVIAKALQEHGVELRGDQRARAIVPSMHAATDEDWDTEYNDLIMAVKVVDSEEAAIAHINAHNTKHSEAIITDNYQNSQRFLQQVDAAVVYVNASTRFTDGFEFGFGAEIGISTQKLHARGPMGLAALTTIKYQVLGNGQVRED
ncbi:glutamate-5-semialdehyde dehydrogenase [Lacticaseibacillus zeae]|uniref:Gamma-glutamyl phosphate reductase n=1 Tax=Lacticaseibacillus zeae subsp. silagei TaxID=3068307 RepID=A0ABD7Z815_LACZE|nr:MULTISPECIES: glutamate-5-semialdehyde dehydrogenase [Lacticaseibacillus]MDE3316027.1 glutamate-5-semialdehyde dehydrogenase [Lacticaseibacillus zeae]OFS01484.1 gamma-glutamyl-phosphate reductase [Lactobacillus sp. HMSC068F07]WLV83068.1 glutamate-5-semialdehyde dehydrogenase [Lacticaseibacillus sp. NCIMB 15475]WLV85817.1 glutamate-5-semialdehyde dehydrogenase [Lacticaseibacillus sp. NCIMB 15474]